MVKDDHFPERRAINILVAYWRLWHNKSPDRVHPAPNIVEIIAKCSVGNVFFTQVYSDLRAGSSGKYANFTELDFTKFLEAEYHQEAPVQLERKRKKYENVCWHCGTSISSDILKRCSECGWYICGNCGSCKRECSAS